MVMKMFEHRSRRTVFIGRKYYHGEFKRMVLKLGGIPNGTPAILPGESFACGRL
jgi:hypothetical protein